MSPVGPGELAVRLVQTRQPADLGSGNRCAWDGGSPGTRKGAGACAL